MFIIKKTKSSNRITWIFSFLSYILCFYLTRRELYLITCNSINSFIIEKSVMKKPKADFVMDFKYNDPLTIIITSKQ